MKGGQSLSSFSVTRDACLSAEKKHTTTQRLLLLSAHSADGRRQENDSRKIGNVYFILRKYKKKILPFMCDEYIEKSRYLSRYRLQRKEIEFKSNRRPNRGQLSNDDGKA